MTNHNAREIPGPVDVRETGCSSNGQGTMAGELTDRRSTGAVAICSGHRPSERTLFDQQADIQTRFEEFDREHPEVWAYFVRFANELLARSERGSADQIMQRIRWETTVNPERDGGLKLNDHFSSRYARKLAKEDRRFETFFSFRTIKA
jgi:hypothetical protein